MRTHPKTCATLTLAVVALAALPALADPVKRYQSDQRGNFIIFGNTLGYDCQASVPTPLIGTVGTCISPTGSTSSLDDSAPDVFWRSDAPDAGDAMADDTVTPAQARSTAGLQLPPGAVITYARLYWAARTDGTTFGATATVERPGNFSVSVVADQGLTGSRQGEVFYQSSADVTELLRTWGVGPYRVGNIDTVNVVDANDDTLFIAWGMVVFYSLDSDPPRQLTLFDGLEQLPRTNGDDSLTTTISGFLVPSVGFDAKLGVMSYEGDSSITGDQFFFNGGAALTHGAASTGTNFFDGSRTDLSGPVSVDGDLPKLSGLAGSNTGVDTHVLDVTSRLASGQTSTTVKASTSSDFFVLGVFVTSIATLKPVFTNTFKTFTDLNGGDILKGDLIQYDISTQNTGTDVGVNTIITDPLPQEVEFVPGSLQIVTGASAGPLTDAIGDDVGEYDPTTRLVTVRVGTGATATQGGSLAVNDSVSVRFNVRLQVSTGQVQNQALLNAQGQQGAVQGIASASFNSDASGTGEGTPTVFGVDECSVDADCPAARPFCDATANPNRCVACVASSDCKNPTPVCDVEGGTCAGCTQDAECNDPAAPHCNVAQQTCVSALKGVTPSGFFEGAGCGGCSAGVGPGMGALAWWALFLRRRR